LFFFEAVLLLDQKIIVKLPSGHVRQPLMPLLMAGFHFARQR